MLSQGEEVPEGKREREEEDRLLNVSEGRLEQQLSVGLFPFVCMKIIL